MSKKVGRKRNIARSGKAKQCRRRGLTVKQQAFVNAYTDKMCWGNATAAARAAGYKGSEGTLAQTGYENLRKPEILAAIQERLMRCGLSSTETLFRLSRIARFDPAECYDYNKDGSASFNMQKARELGVVDLIKKHNHKMTIDSVGNTFIQTSVEIHDMHGALRDFMKLHNLTGKTQVEISGIGGTPIQTEQRVTHTDVLTTSDISPELLAAIQTATDDDGVLDHTKLSEEHLAGYLNLVDMQGEA